MDNPIRKLGASFNFNCGGGEKNTFRGREENLIVKRVLTLCNRTEPWRNKGRPSLFVGATREGSFTSVSGKEKSLRGGV